MVSSSALLGFGPALALLCDEQCTSSPVIRRVPQQRARQATMRRRAVAAQLLAVHATALIMTPPPRIETRRHATETDVDFADAQWQLYAAQSGRWEGVWTTFDSQGIEQLAHTGCWDVSLDGDDAVHKMEVPGPDGYPRQIPVGTYTRGKLGRQTCAGQGMVSGPTLLRSGLMSTELLLRYGASRLRVAVQHAPAEANEGVEDAVPALLCFRCVVARERCDAELGAPTREVEATRWQGHEDDLPDDKDDTHFWKGRSPYSWRRDWVGESDVAIRDTLEHFELPDGLDDEESWHESTRSGEASYNLALPGGIRVQAPQIIPAAVPVPIRVAWMPNAQTLLRAEGVVTALEAVEGNDERLAPPRLVTFRADCLKDRGPKPGDPIYVDPEPGE